MRTAPEPPPMGRGDSTAHCRWDPRHAGGVPSPPGDFPNLRWLSTAGINPMADPWDYCIFAFDGKWLIAMCGKCG